RAGYRLRERQTSYRRPLPANHSPPGIRRSALQCACPAYSSSFSAGSRSAVKAPDLEQLVAVFALAKPIVFHGTMIGGATLTIGYRGHRRHGHPGRGHGNAAADYRSRDFASIRKCCASSVNWRSSAASSLSWNNAASSALRIRPASSSRFEVSAHRPSRYAAYFSSLPCRARVDSFRTLSPSAWNGPVISL